MSWKFITLVGVLAFVAGCGLTGAQLQEGASTAGGILTGAAPVIPAPFGPLLGALGVILTGAGGIFGQRARNQASQLRGDPNDVNSLARLFGERSWLGPVAASAISAANGAFGLGMSEGDLAILYSTLSLPVATHLASKDAPASGASSEPPAAATQ